MLSVFIPVYNEEKRTPLSENLERLVKILKKLNEDWEIVVVDDNSADNTREIVKQIMKKNRKIKLITHKVGPSVRENLAQSFKFGKGDIISFMDADLSSDIRYLPELIGWIKRGYDISTGSRWMKTSKVKRDKKRLLISWFYKIFTKLLFNSRINDHQCGFKAFKRNIILGLVEDAGRNGFRSWSWDTEILIRSQRKGYKIKEFPIRWTTKEESTTSILKDSKLVLYLLFLRIKLIFD